MKLDRSLDRRQCGPCTACCIDLKIVAPELKKDARVPCPHLSSAGCGIYDSRPGVCREFLCGWRLFDDMDKNWRPDLSGILAMRRAPSEMPAAWQHTPYGIHMVSLTGEEAVMRPAFITYVQKKMADGIPIFLSAASPFILLNEHIPAGAETSVVKQRMAELYPLIHASRFGQSLWTRIRFLYALQIDRGRQKYLNKSNG